MRNIFDKISQCKKGIAVLVDPDKFEAQDSNNFYDKLNLAKPDFIFIGGSTLKKINLDPIIKRIKKISNLPIIIFPGTILFTFFSLKRVSVFTSIFIKF